MLTKIQNQISNSLKTLFFIIFIRVTTALLYKTGVIYSNLTAGIVEGHCNSQNVHIAQCNYTLYQISSYCSKQYKKNPILLPYHTVSTVTEKRDWEAYCLCLCVHIFILVCVCVYVCDTDLTTLVPPLMTCMSTLQVPFECETRLTSENSACKTEKDNFINSTHTSCITRDVINAGSYLSIHK